jgi:hypothetical protein
MHRVGGAERLAPQQNLPAERGPVEFRTVNLIPGCLAERRLPRTEEVEHPLDQDCGGIRVVRRQGAVGEIVVVAG